MRFFLVLPARVAVFLLNRCAAICWRLAWELQWKSETRRSAVFLHGLARGFSGYAGDIDSIFDWEEKEED